MLILEENVMRPLHLNSSYGLDQDFGACFYWTVQNIKPVRQYSSAKQRIQKERILTKFAWGIFARF